MKLKIEGKSYKTAITLFFFYRREKIIYINRFKYKNYMIKVKDEKMQKI